MNNEFEILKEKIKMVAEYLQKKYPNANLETIQSAILSCIKDPSDIHMFDSFEKYVDFNFGKFYIKQRLNDNKIKVN